MSIPDYSLAPDPFPPDRFACFKAGRRMPCGALLVAGRGGRIGEAIEYAGVAQEQLCAGNSEVARRNALQAIMALDDVREYTIRPARFGHQARNSARAFEAHPMTLDVGADDQKAQPKIGQLGLKAGQGRGVGKAADRILLFADTRQKYNRQIVLAEAQITAAGEARAIQAMEQTAPNDATESAHLEGLLSRVTPGQIRRVVGGICATI